MPRRDPLDRMIVAADAGYATAEPFKFRLLGSVLRLFVREPIAACGFPLGEASTVIAHFAGIVAPKDRIEQVDGAAVYEVETAGLCSLHIRTGAAPREKRHEGWFIWDGADLIPASAQEAASHRASVQRMTQGSLPTLDGSPAQVAWANELRARFSALHPDSRMLRNAKAAWWISQRYALGVA